MSAWSDLVDRSTRFTAAREVGAPGRFIVWVTRLGRTYTVPHVYEARDAKEACELARAEMEAFEDFVNRAL